MLHYFKHKFFRLFAVLILCMALPSLAGAWVTVKGDGYRWMKFGAGFRSSFQKLAYPILLLPFLSRGSDIIGKRILFKFDRKTFLLNFNVNVSSNVLDKKFPLLAKKG